MKPVLYAKQHKEADEQTSQKGLPQAVLMERAALSVVSVLCHRKWIPAEKKGIARICIVCGTGNNGGDGAAVARLLDERGIPVDLFTAGNPEKQSKMMQLQMSLLADTQVRRVDKIISGRYDLVIDAVFGIGLHRPLEGEFLDVVEQINNSQAKVVAVDMPSGVHTDTGEIMGTAVRADLTVTFTALKPGLLLYPGKACAGETIIKKIGIRADTQKTALACLEEMDIRALPKRAPEGNKGTFGKVLVVAGSEEISGAAFLAAKAALCSGAGMVRIYTAEKNRTILGTLLPEALITTWESGQWQEEPLHKALHWADAVLAGPGLGMTEQAYRILSYIMEKNFKPCVLDADALNLLALHPELWKKRNFPCVVTPHVGEMHRLTGMDIRDIKGHSVSVAADFAQNLQVTCLLKDAVSVTAEPDGFCYLNPTGCSALATAGSGDVLAGITAGLLARFRGKHLPLAASAAWIHGKAGECAAEEKSCSAVLASDLFAALPAILD